MTQVLNVWFEGALLGELSIHEGRWQFQYTKQWINNPSGFVLSPFFPISNTHYLDNADDKRVEWYFENLLPEGGIRDALARHARTHPKDLYGLLKRYGEESAGALTILSADVDYSQQGKYEAISSEQLRLYLQKSGTSPLLVANEQLHMSLAGVQNKVGVRYLDENIFLPVGAAASTHILKPENTNVEFECCPANEYFCMQLANALKLPVPGTTLIHIPEALYLVSRFDRRIEKEFVIRLHQIDLCQMLNKWEGYKYESHGGITLPDIFSAVNKTTQPAVSRDLVLRWFIYNYLIGNNDAHAKNLSFMVNKNTITVAPFYDLLCVQAYLPESVMAMSIDGENKPGWIEADHWNKLAEIAGVKETLIFSYLSRMSNSILTHAQNILLDDAFTETEKKFITGRIFPVIQQRVAFAKDVCKD